MKTFLGNISPLPEDGGTPHLIDIVVHLGRTRRFGGWANKEWTVLHHSMFTMLLYLRAVGAHGAHHAALHDVHEYITGDIPTPVKHAIGMEKVRALENFIDKKVYEKLTIPERSNTFDAVIKHCDFAALIIESFYFGDKALDLGHIGEKAWAKTSFDDQREIARIVYASCPEVYEAMVASDEINPPRWDKLLGGGEGYTKDDPWGRM